MNAILNQYIEILRLGEKSPNTLRSYIKDIEKLFNYFSIENVSELQNISVEKYFEFYQAQKISPNSLNGLIRNLTAFFNFLLSSSLIESTCPFFKVKFGKSKFVEVKRKKKDILSPDEEELLIQSGSNLQEKFMLALCLWTALRNQEIADIKMSDIEDCKIKITGKGGDEDFTYMNSRLCEMMSEYVAKERNTDSEYLFYATRGDEEKGKLSGTSVNNRVKKTIEKAGIQKKITTHRLRATRITNVAFEHGDRTAQAIARHSSPATTNLYIGKNDVAVKNIMTGDK